MGSIALLGGCPNPSLYGTPRTTPAGHFSHTVALEGASLSGEVPSGTTPQPGTTNAPAATTEKYSVTYPMAPTYQLRFGVSDRVDLGVRVANLSSLGIDGKYNFYRSNSIDIAVDPGVQGSYWSASAGGADSTISLLYFHLPVVFGVNAGDSFTIVPIVGATYIRASNSLSSGGRDGLVTASGFTARFGLGLDIRTSARFALHPEVTAMRLLETTANTYLVFGLGFNFGTLPTYEPSTEEKEVESDTRDREAEREREREPDAPAAKASPGSEPPPSRVVSAPGTCATSCELDSMSSLSTRELDSVANGIAPMLRSLRTCLDRVSAGQIRPAVLVRFGEGGVPATARVDVGGFEKLDCVNEAAAKGIATRVSRPASVRCELRCD